MAIQHSQTLRNVYRSLECGKREAACPRVAKEEVLPWGGVQDSLLVEVPDRWVIKRQERCPCLWPAQRMAFPPAKFLGPQNGSC